MGRASVPTPALYPAFFFVLEKALKSAGNAVISTLLTHRSYGLQHLRHKRPTFAFSDESGYTLAFANRIAHSGLHAETGVFRTGVVSLPSERSARSRTSPGRVSERQTLPLLGLGRVYARRTQKACGTAMRLCVSLSRRRRGPAGLRCPVAAARSARFSGIERLDQAFRQSYYHTQRPHGQPLGACVGAALGGKMRAITLDFKENHHGRT